MRRNQRREPKKEGEKYKYTPAFWCALLLLFSIRNQNIYQQQQQQRNETAWTGD
jgi:hypothetical protein